MLISINPYKLLKGFWTWINIIIKGTSLPGIPFSQTDWLHQNS